MKKILLIAVSAFLWTSVFISESKAAAVYTIPTYIQKERGHPVVMVVFRTGCGRCRRYFPEFSQLFKKYSSKRVRFLGLSTDKEESSFNNYKKKSPFPYPTYYISPWPKGSFGDTMEKLGIRIGQTFGIPLVAVFDKKGKLIRSWEQRVPFSELENAILQSL